MTAVILVSEVRFAPAKPELRARGLRGWVCFVVDAKYRVDGVAVRRSEDGRWLLSYPARTDSAGRAHAYWKPESAQARDEISGQVRDALRRGGWIA